MLNIPKGSGRLAPAGTVYSCHMTMMWLVSLLSEFRREPRTISDLRPKEHRRCCLRLALLFRWRLFIDGGMNRGFWHRVPALQQSLGNEYRLPNHEAGWNECRVGLGNGRPILAGARIPLGDDREALSLPLDEMSEASRDIPRGGPSRGRLSRRGGSAAREYGDGEEHQTESCRGGKTPVCGHGNALRDGVAAAMIPSRALNSSKSEYHGWRSRVPK